MNMRLRRPLRGFTLIEVFVGVAILVIILGLGVPSLRDWMIAQRVSSVASELATDMRFARSDATSGNDGGGVDFKNTANGCYTVFRGTPPRGASCDCTRPAGTVCTGPLLELKTVVLPAGEDVSINASASRVLYATGATLTLVTGAAATSRVVTVDGGGTRKLHVITTTALHHPRVCKPSGSTIPGFQSCP
ncbi:prepilin-type N-terminal cleavage/methylation domain-containing protein [Aquincola sp. S2]|uniref:Type II secretion system protein H n=1 Tax=Pseudaquabacterium terrae TaxID=2732868 RepID=A0ABX2EQM6_9BURK|nr:prepilin-type N-terminal cleavage/methylation domain-containing protein [Aquabacterium terrae]NRF70903.1 prepilin-type N-terminal cleavage/methylation domain-containing protein [Aquabacterium terrae]